MDTMSRLPKQLRHLHIRIYPVTLGWYERKQNKASLESLLHVIQQAADSVPKATLAISSASQIPLDPLCQAMVDSFLERLWRDKEAAAKTSVSADATMAPEAEDYVIVDKEGDDTRPARSYNPADIPRFASGHIMENHPYMCGCNEFYSESGQRCVPFCLAFTILLIRMAGTRIQQGSPVLITMTIVDFCSISLCFNDLDTNVCQTF